jgi:L,D-transpeptidase ErfK/SrfK
LTGLGQPRPGLKKWFEEILKKRTAVLRSFSSAILKMVLLSLIPGGVFLAGPPARSAEPVFLSREMTGGIKSYRVRPGDILLGIRSRFGLSLSTLVRENVIRDPDLIYPGQILRIDSRHLVPPSPGDGILINLPEKMLFYFSGGGLVLSAPVALGKPSWPTPEGRYRVVVKRIDPDWVVPPSIQREMRRQGQRILRRVPPGPDNPLGHYWLGLSLPNYGIHGTNAPSSIYTLTTHGCIRLNPGDIEALFGKVSLGTPVWIVDRPVLLERSPKGRLYLEVHPDVYHGEEDLSGDFFRWLSRHREIRIDAEKARQVLRNREGRPVDVTPTRSLAPSSKRSPP